MCWGDSTDGEMGLGDSVAAMLGGIFEAGDAWALGELALGPGLTCMLRGGAVSCAGADDAADLGPSAPHFPADETTPVPVPLGPTGTSVATELVAGNGFGCALLEDRSIECWGWDGYSSLGRFLPAGEDDCAGVPATFGPCHRTPASIDAPGLRFVHVWGGGGFSPFVCAQIAGGDTYCWGALETGDCIFGGAPPCVVPRAFAPFAGATAVASGLTSVCATFADGHVTCVGRNDYGQLGRTTFSPTTTILADDVHVVGL